MKTATTNIQGKAPVYSYRQIWTVAYPILISLVMEQMIGMTDTAFMGRVGETELGASAIAGVFYMVVFMIGFGFSIGSQIIIARRNGEGRFQETGNVFYHGVCFLLGLAAVMVVLSEMFSPWLIGKMVSSPAIADAALSYVKWRIPGLFFAYVTAMFRAFYVGTTQTRTLTLNSITMVLSNVVFNWIFVFGKLGVPAMGIAGAAIGSTLAEFVSLVFFIRPEQFQRLSFQKTRRHTDSLDMDNDTERRIPLHVAHILPVHRTPRRNASGSVEHHQECIGADVDGSYGFLLHLQLPRKQHHRKRTSGCGERTGNQDTETQLCCSGRDGGTHSAFPSCRAENLYEHS